jgi:hypothetical protein
LFDSIVQILDEEPIQTRFQLQTIKKKYLNLQYHITTVTLNVKVIPKAAFKENITLYRAELKNVIIINDEAFLGCLSLH